MFEGATNLAKLGKKRLKTLRHPINLQNSVRFVRALRPRNASVGCDDGLGRPGRIPCLKQSMVSVKSEEFLRLIVTSSL